MIWYNNEVMLYYRPFLKTDLDMWENLARSEFSESDFCDKKYFMENWDKINGFILYNKENEWIGCCFLKSGYQAHNPEGMHFLEVITFPQFRNKGYAKYLYKIMFDRACGKTKSVCINPDNTASMNLAKKYGFAYIAMRHGRHVLLCDKDYYPDELKRLDKEPKISFIPNLKCAQIDQLKARG